jgi:hypothetical protein
MVKSAIIGPPAARRATSSAPSVSDIPAVGWYGPSGWIAGSPRVRSGEPTDVPIVDKSTDSTSSARESRFLSEIAGSPEDEDYGSGNFWGFIGLSSL